MSWDKSEKAYAGALLGSSLVSVALYLVGAKYYDGQYLWFLNWNLFLAWIPLLASTTLIHYIKNNPWVSWYGALLTIIWLSFIPNSFYLITDLIHISNNDVNSALFYSVMLFSFALNGMILGYTSVYQIHKQLIKRFSLRTAHYIIVAILLLCSFAMYMGRFLRWSTWDIVANPAGVLFDVSDRIINPVDHGQTFQITALLFVLLGSFYMLTWKMLSLLRSQPK